MRIFLREMKKRIIDDDILFDRAAQLAYYFLMSLFPFLLVTITLLGFLPLSSEDVLKTIRPYAPPMTYQLIESNLAVILGERSAGVLSVSLIITIYLASRAFQSIIRILDDAYQVAEDRPLWKEFVLGFFLMFGILFAFVTSLLLPVFGKVLGEYLFRITGMAPELSNSFVLVRWLFSSTVILVVFWSMYVFAPNTKIKIREALPGTLFATLSWQAISLGFSYYVSLNDYTLIYGNLGAIIVLLSWFYISAMILILGGLINASLVKARELKVRREKKLRGRKLKR